MNKLSVPSHRGNGVSSSTVPLEAALRYAEKGWFVLPVHAPIATGCSCLKYDCASIGKHPRNHNGSTGASRDETKIRRWWTQWPEANVGIATGARSGIFVLDVDGDAGQASLQALGSLPTTLRADSGRTGANGARNSFHLYFKYPVGVNLTSGVNTLGKGLDVRSDGGYVVAAPSIHKSGLSYEWLDAESEVAIAPDWFIAQASKFVAGPVLTSGTNFLYEGQRNIVLYRLAAKWRRLEGIGFELLMARLRGQNTRRCKPELDQSDIEKIARSAAKQPFGGLDPLELAWKEAQAEGHYYAWDRFLAVLRHLHNQRPGAILLLPVERIGQLIGCDHALVSRFRRRAIADGFIRETEKSVAHQLATKFAVLRLPEVSVPGEGSALSH